MGPLFEATELPSQLLFVFVAVAGQPALAPDVGLLGDD